MSYILTVGLEIHLKIKSSTKLFCRCPNSQDFDGIMPNTNICPVCTGQPGALPVLSHEPLMQSLLLGRALGCTIHPRSSFDRKSYHYPDLPMGYQITQFYAPTCTAGQITFFDDQYDTSHTVSIRQCQMETDTAKAVHLDGESLIDCNRAGTPLVEVVTNPDFHTAEQAVWFLKELQRLVRYNDISDADMEKGQMRVDVNISVAKRGEPLGTRIELKNMNSLSAIGRGIAYEYTRQCTLLDAGGTVQQQTCRRDDIAGHAVVMRSKEDALDYRYFPEPDLPPLVLSQEILDTIYTHTLDIPSVLARRCKDEFGFHKEYIHGLINDDTTMRYFLACLDAGCDPKTTAKWLCGPIMAYTKLHFLTVDDMKFDRVAYISFVRLAYEGKILAHHFKTIMDEMISTGDTPEYIIQRLGLTASDAIDTSALDTVIDTVIASNPAIVQQYRDGKVSAIGFFVGQVMKQTSGQYDPSVIKEKLEKVLYG